LKAGGVTIGALVFRGWEGDPPLADSVASLVAMAVERTRAIQKENHAEAERNVEQLRTAVLDGLAHGFKSPLTAIQTASSGLLAIAHLNPTQAELVGIIDEQATVLGRMTTRLLQTAALETKEVGLHKISLSVRSLLQNVIEQHDEATCARIHLSVPEDLAAIQVDAQMMELAIEQLLDNAAKYSPVGRDIEVSVRQDEAETVISVENEGSSIRAEERERIFERFYRGIDTAHGPTGTGLGLSIVKKTAEAHHGRVWVDCTETTTRFSLALPRHERNTHG
jgi:two-component system sensor histidine kinase KdpD